MRAERRTFDWRSVHAELDRRLSMLGATHERNELRTDAATLPWPPKKDKTPPETVAVFCIGGKRYALALGCCREITRLSRAAILPGPAAEMVGIINWRGEFVTVIDTLRLLGLGSGEQAALRYAIVLRGEELRVALAVEGFDGVTRLDPSQLQAPSGLGLKDPEMIRGVTRDAVLVIANERLQARLKDILRPA